MSLFQVKLNCPACGAPLTIEHRFVRVVTCEFCGQVSLLHGSALEPTGQTASLFEMPSRLYLGATGRLEGQPFKAIGRLRYQYADGYWDEWLLTLENDQVGWLAVDEGISIFYSAANLTGPLPPFETLRAGHSARLGQYHLFVTETGQAVIAGGEGQVAFEFLPAEQIRYADGACEAGLVSLEYARDSVRVFIGREINSENLVIDEDGF